jgi:dephospho-CoA kinase
MNVIGLIGLPGAGKTTAMNGITDRVDVDVFGLQMRNVARDCYEAVDELGMDGFSDSFNQALTGSDVAEEDLLVTGDFEEEIGDWVDTVLSVDGEYFASRAAAQIQSRDADFCVVDGIRSTADADIFAEESDNCVFYFLHCPFETRLTRIQQRDGGMTAQELIERDRQELSWGLRDILSEYNYQNGDGDSFQQKYPIKYIPSMETADSTFESESVGKFLSDISFHVSDTLDNWDLK